VVGGLKVPKIAKSATKTIVSPSLVIIILNKLIKIGLVEGVLRGVHAIK